MTASAAKCPVSWDHCWGAHQGTRRKWEFEGELLAGSTWLLSQCVMASCSPGVPGRAVWGPCFVPGHLLPEANQVSPDP